MLLCWLGRNRNTNKQQSIGQTMERILLLVNAGTVKVTTKTMDGEEWWVAPITTLRAGVFPGSNGPLLYQPTVNKSSTRKWNYMPIVVNHPISKTTGQFISAREPEVLDERGIGLVLNSTCDETGTLACNGWFNKTKTTKTLPALATLLADAEAGKPVSPVNVSTGLFPVIVANGGVHDGRQYTAMVSDMEPDHLAILWDQPGACSVADGCGLLANMTTSPLAANESFDEITLAIRRALRDTISLDAYLDNVYPDYFVFELNQGKFYRQGYTFANGTVTLVGAYTPVNRAVSYTPTVNQSSEETMSCTCGGSQSNQGGTGAAPTNQPTNQPAPLANSLDALEPTLRAQVQDSMALAATVRSGLIANIKAAPGNTFSDAELAAMPGTTLQKMASMVTPVANTATTTGNGTSQATPGQTAVLEAIGATGAAPVANQQAVDPRAKGPTTNATQTTVTRQPLALPNSMPTPAKA